MLPEWLSLFPPWLLVGLGLGVVASVAVAGVFVVGGRLFPGQSHATGPRVDGTDRRRAEIRDYLRRIDERFHEDHSVYGHTVAFYLPERDVAITFDAQAYFVIERAGGFAVLCEHEMPAIHLGRRLPFDVPDLEPEIEELDDPVSAAFDHLELPTTADRDAIRTAYRDRVKSVHPDQGGDREEFQRLRDAYQIAKDHAD
ncbi:J domain-containing protein [Salinirubrum litoreum]|uniref:J domain-containing protein n=1 Tax=Salinirubrum litoreum TaxID=1126234 RepID=A0ABD5R892_9EURY